MQKLNRKQSFIKLFTSLLILSVWPTPSMTQESDGVRIISAGGSITEILFELGMGERLVGVDTSSFYPEAANTLPKVGYFRSLGAEGIMSLNPDIVIAAKGAGPEAALEQIKSLGVEIKTYDQASYTIDAWKELVSRLGQDYSKEDKATQLINKVSQGLQARINQRSFTKNSLNAVALLSIGQRGPVAAGQNTVPNLLLKLAGINNLASELDGYKPFSSELLATQKIDLILIPSHVIAGLGGRNAVCQHQVIKLAMPGKCNVHVMDGLLLMGFGARLDQAVGEIIEQANGL